LKVILKVFVFFIVLMGVITWFFLKSSAPEKNHLLTVKEKVVEMVFVERGVIAPSESQIIQTLTKGTIQEIKKHGSRVRKNEVIIRIDNSNSQDKIDQTKMDIKQEELKLEIEKKHYELVDFTEKNTEEVKNARLRHAELAQKEELAKPKADELRRLGIKRQLAVLDLDEAKEKLQRQQSLFTKGFVSKASLEPFQRRLASAGEKEKEASLNINVAKKGITDERRIELQQAVVRYRADLQRASKARQRKLREVQDVINISKEKINELRHKLKNLEFKMKNSTCLAPTDGFMSIRTYRDWDAGGTYAQYAAGVQVREGSVVANVISSASMKVEMTFNEVDFHRLKQGLEVEVEIPAFPGKVFKGKLTSIGAIGKDRNNWLKELSGKSGVSMYNGTVELAGDSSALHPGMSALVKIVLQKKRQALVLPRTAVLQESGAFYVYEDNNRKKIDGRYINEYDFEVTGGLKAGEQVRDLSKEVAQ